MSKSRIIFYVIVLVLIILIIFRYGQVESKIENSELRNYIDEEVVLEGKIVAEPDVRDTNTKLTIESARDPISGRFLVTVPRYPEYQYGDILEIKGKLQEPPVFSAQGGSASGREDFNYKNYLRAQGISAVIYYPQVQKIRRGRTSTDFLLRGIFDFKNKLRQSIYSSMPLPQASVLTALILGDKSAMSQDFKNKLNIAGVSHVIAVSGSHIVILTNILMFLFLGLGFWKKQAIYFSLILIFLYIVLIGFQPSAVRAGIMGSLFLIAPLFGRKSQSVRTIIIAVLAMLAFNPLLLLYDISFQLSFLSSLGIIYLFSIFNRLLKFIPSDFLGIREILATTFSAYLFSLPILAYNFGRASLIAPISNILILPIFPLLMAFGFIFSIIGVFIPFLGWILSFIPYFLLSYLVLAVELLSQPWFSQTLNNIHWFWLIISYFFLIPLSYYFYKKERKLFNSLNY